ncbi:MAG: hypothetical protein ABIT37_02145 [Luteolibacter sp.]
MPSPKTTLPLLLGGAIGAAGILQGLHWKSTATPADRPDTGRELRAARDEIEMLRRENESLRSLAQGGGKLSVPEELADRTEKETGLRFLSNPVVHRIAAEELRGRIGAAIESRLGPSGIDDRQEAAILIGWLEPGDDLLVQLTASLSAGAGGWFDDVTGEAWMLDKSDLKNIPDQATLVGLLERILLHQHFPPPASHPDDDAARAREALHQGAASAAVARFLTEKARTIGFMQMKEDKESEQLIASLSPYIQGLRNFSFIEGKGLADSLYVKGSEPFLTTFRNPPQTTRAIVAADTAAEIKPLDLPTTPEEPLLSESAGQLGLRLWLDAAGDAEAASEVAGCWKNDRYVLFPDGESSTALLWEIELTTGQAADQLQSAALALAGKMAGQPENAAPGRVLVSESKRHLAIIRPSPLRVRFINTSEATTAAAISGK